MRNGGLVFVKAHLNKYTEPFRKDAYALRIAASRSSCDMTEELPDHTGALGTLVIAVT